MQALLTPALHLLAHMCTTTTATTTTTTTTSTTATYYYTTTTESKTHTHTHKISNSASFLFGEPGLSVTKVHVVNDSGMY